MNKILGLILAATSLVQCGRVAYAQVPQLSHGFTGAPISNQSTGQPRYQTTVKLLPPGLAVDYALPVGTISLPPAGSTSQNQVILSIDLEAMAVQSVVNGVPQVRRGSNSTRSFAHGALANVWIGDQRLFQMNNPLGDCVPAAVTVSPWVNVISGSAFTCQGDGTWGGATFQWRQATAIPAGISSAKPYPFSWMNATNLGVWESIFVEQGDFTVANISWDNATWKWSDTAGLEPQILNVLP